MNTMENSNTLKPSEFYITPEEMFKSYGNHVFRLAMVWVANRTVAEDILQEVFLRVLKTKPRFNDQNHMKAWLIRVTVNCAKSHLTSAHNRHRASFEENLSESSKTEFSEILLAVYSLAPKYKTVVHLHYYEDMTTDEIAKALSISQSAVKQRLKRARAKLKDIMTGDEF